MDCEKSAKIKRVGVLRGGLQKKWKIMWVGAIRGRLRVDCEKSAKLRGLGITGWIAKKVQN